MATIKINGASDDVIEVDGAVQDEFYCYTDDGQQGRLSFSDGTTLHVHYEPDGVWRITEDQIGTASVVNIEVAQAGYRSDVATITGDIAWIRVASDGGRGPRRVEVE